MHRLGSLCTGYGGLDLAAEAVLGPLEHAWHAEIDPHASTVLAHHWPATPNLGDLTAVDWTQAEPIDVLTAGYPCQPLSLAGRRAGLTDERWIWDDVIRAVRALRPRLVLLENVAGHLSLGFGRVLGDLAAAGFDAEWGCFRASDVGAPHRRERVFIAAWPSDSPPDAGHLAGRVGVSTPGDHGVTLLPTPAARDWRSGESNIMDRNARPLNEVIVNLLPTPNAALGRGTGTPSPATATERYAQGKRFLDDAVALLPARWGQYAPAVARWQEIIGRPAPSATEAGTRGQRRLASAFVEWLMGLPAGWVTDHLPRNPALKCLGNGVVWQQAAHAYTELLGTR
ncbi:DNA cytosine methyltransferase [Micromonospora chalcea]|uniref:DNA cytosine methyltransferase n=1 Tax=Micromonospora chalcea TaxID=1874 RepID=UPI0037F8FD9E